VIFPHGRKNNRFFKILKGFHDKINSNKYLGKNKKRRKGKTVVFKKSWGSPFLHPEIFGFFFIGGY
jgi:hypothetical protein